MMNLQGSKVLVTGASSGIGRQIAIDLAEQGARVVLVARNETELQNTLSQMIGDGHQICSFDLQNIEGIAELVKSAVVYDGLKFDGFVHSAGIPGIYPLKVINYVKFEEVFKVNFYSYLEIVKNLSKKSNSNEEMSVVYISSGAIMDQTPSQILYIASKAAAQNIAKVFEKELKKRNFRFNVVTPLWVDTKMARESAVFRNVNIDNVEVKGIHPREIANAVLFLLSDKAKFINGEDITVG